MGVNFTEGSYRMLPKFHNYVSCYMRSLRIAIYKRHAYVKLTETVRKLHNVLKLKNARSL